MAFLEEAHVELSLHGERPRVGRRREEQDHLLDELRRMHAHRIWSALGYTSGGGVEQRAQ